MLRSLVAAVVASLTTAVTIAIVHQHPEPPHCPTEDSCSIDYHDGTWTVYPSPDVECDTFESPAHYICVDGSTGEVLL